MHEGTAALALLVLGVALFGSLVVAIGSEEVLPLGRALPLLLGLLLVAEAELGDLVDEFLGDVEVDVDELVGLLDLVVVGELEEIVLEVWVGAGVRLEKRENSFSKQGMSLKFSSLASTMR
jgi:hypothetical protein